MADIFGHPATLATLSPEAIGDIIHGPMLAHKAEDEGAMVAESLGSAVQPREWGALKSGSAEVWDA